jgi:type VI secretion system secreted protein VgrG
MKVMAANGNVSLRAHTDTLRILADQQVEVLSVNDEIQIMAPQHIEFVGGQSGLVLQGGDITFACPGQWSAKGSMQAFLGGGGSSAQLAGLPDARVGELPRWLELELRGWEAKALPNVPYVVTFADGSKREGTLDANGFAHLDGIPKGMTHKVVYQNPPVSADPAPYTLDDLSKSIRAFLNA